MKPGRTSLAWMIGAISVLGLIGILIVPMTTLFLAFLLGLLVLPPALVLISIFKQGAPIILNERKEFAGSGRFFFVISSSKDHFIIEPQIK